jgi:type IV pilus assembly protein PilA
MSTNGFTLIEILVVVAVIAILAAVMIPNLLQSRQAAQNSDAQALTRNAASMAEIRRSEYGDRVVYAAATDCVSHVVDFLSQSVLSCQVKQDSNTSYVLTRAVTGKYYFFNGERIQGPLDTLPTAW